MASRITKVCLRVPGDSRGQHVDTGEYSKHLLWLSSGQGWFRHTVGHGLCSGGKAGKPGHFSSRELGGQTAAQAVDQE